MGSSRMHHDVSDFHKVRNFLLKYNPFKFVDTTQLIYLSSGVVAVVDDSVNCEQADKIGSVIQRKWDQSCFGAETLKKPDRVKTMANLTRVCSVESQNVNIDPNTLLHCLIIAGETFVSLHSALRMNCEITPFPMSFFQGWSDEET